MIPNELKELKSWMYCNEQNNAPADKNGKITSWTNKNNWVNYNDKTKVFLLDGDYVVIDFDRCLDENGNLYDWALDFVNPFLNNGYYIEYSRSRRGLHIIGKGQLPKNISIKMNNIHKKYKDLHKKSGIEIFVNHAITLTGIAYKNNALDFINEIDENFNILYNYLVELNNRNINKKTNYSNSIDLFNYVKSSISLKDVFSYYCIDYNTNKNINCPFPGHDDKKASFKIYDSTDSYNCFAGCGGGSIIDFVMKIENLNKLEAVKFLAEKFNLDIEFNENINNPQFINNTVDKQVENLDLKSVKWDPDYTFVKYVDPLGENGSKKTQRMSEYFLEFPDKNGPTIKDITPLPVTENVKCLLKHYNIEIKFNIIKNSFDVFENDIISKYNLENFIVIIRDNADKQNFKITKDKIIDIIIKIALDNEYNPIEDYLKEAHEYYLKNPDKEIFNKLMDTINSESEWKNKFIGKFLLQMIYLGICEDESQVAADYMLVLLGKQFIGKTTWLRNLLPEKFRSKYFLGGRTLDPTNKDDRIETVTNWLVEMGEISSTFRKADQEALKNFITDFKDKFRLPYAKEAIEKKRRTCLCGSTNDIEYLKDLTGTRRFLTLNCISFDKETKIDIDMLWGYMYSLYLKGVSYKFTNNEVEQIMISNEKYLNKPEKILIIEDVWNLNPPENKGIWLTGQAICSELPDNNLLNRFTIGRELKKNKIKWKRDKHTKKDLFFVCRLSSYNENINYDIDEKKEPF
jgi:putative DNA primase/helicase